MVEGEIVQMVVPGFSDAQKVQVMVSDEIVQYDSFIVERASVMESKFEDVLLRSK